MTFARHVGEGPWSPEARRRPRALGAGSLSRLRASGVWLPVVAAGASSTTAATTLRTQLGRIASPSPASSVDATSPAIVVGLTSELPGKAGPGRVGWRVVGFRFYVYGTSTAYLVAATYQLLQALGYAALSPAADWEILPTVGPDVSAPAGVDRYPPAFVDGIGEGGGVVTEQIAPLADWVIRAGLPSDGKAYRFGHRWASFVLAHPAELVPGGGRVSSTGSKLKTTDATVQALAISDSHAEDNGTAAVISWEAADGTNGWSEVGPLSPADLQITIANAVRPTLTTCDVGFLGYSSTTDPLPTVHAVAGLWCLVSDGFLLGGRTVEEVRDGYLAVGVQHLGLYSQASLWDINYALPGLGQLVDTSKVLRMAGRMAWSDGAILDVADSWIHSMRGLWAVLGPPGQELARWNAMPALAFPSAPGPATALFDLMQVLNSDSQVFVAALALLDATSSAPAAEHRRALDVACWAVYLRLYRVYRNGPTPARLEVVLIWLWRLFRGAFTPGTARWVAAYRFPYFDPVWAADEAVLSAQYGVPNLNTTNQPWVFVAVTEAEIRAALA